MRFLFFTLAILANLSGAEPQAEEALDKKLFEDIIKFQKLRYMQRIQDASHFDDGEYGDFGNLIWFSDLNKFECFELYLQKK